MIFLITTSNLMKLLALISFSWLFGEPLEVYVILTKYYREIK